MKGYGSVVQVGHSQDEGRGCRDFRRVWMRCFSARGRLADVSAARKGDRGRGVRGRPRRMYSTPLM